MARLNFGRDGRRLNWEFPLVLLAHVSVATVYWENQVTRYSSYWECAIIESCIDESGHSIPRLNGRARREGITGCNFAAYARLAGCSSQIIELVAHIRILITAILSAHTLSRFKDHNTQSHLALTPRDSESFVAPNNIQHNTQSNKRSLRNLLIGFVWWALPGPGGWGGGGGILIPTIYCERVNYACETGWRLVRKAHSVPP